MKHSANLCLRIWSLAVLHRYKAENQFNRYDFRVGTGLFYMGTKYQYFLLYDLEPVVLHRYKADYVCYIM